MTEALPDTLAHFLDASSRSFDRLYRPSWLLSELAEPSWQIRFGESIREVDGVVKGAARIRWSLTLPDGCLSDPSHCLLLEHAKLLLIAAFDGATSSSKTLAAVTAYHRHLLWLVEYWVTHGPGLHLQRGLLGLDADAIEAFLSIYGVSGVAGISRACERWDEWIFGLVQQEKPRLEAAIDAMTPRERERFRICTVPEPGPSVPALELRLGEAREARRALARVLLHKLDAYDRRGVIKAGFVQEAIGIDAPRVSRIAPLVRHLQRYETCRDYDFRSYPRYGVRTAPLVGRLSLEEKAAKPVKVNNLLNWTRQASQALTLIPSLASGTFADPSEMGERLARFHMRREGRTRSIPTPVALRLTGFCIDWIQNVEPQLRGLVDRVLESSVRDGDAKPGDLQASLEGVPVPPALQRFGVKMFWGRSLWEDRYSQDAPLAGRQVQDLAVTDLLNVHVGVCFVLVAMLACCRRSEVLMLSKGSIEHRGDRAYIRILLRKTGADEARLSLLKPVPKIVARCFDSLSSMARILDRYRPTRDGHVAGLLFTKFNRNGLSEAAPNIYSHLDLLSEVADLRTGDDSVWHVRPHELRRFFALSFFHEGGRENSLPALSWFMGHREIHMTWRYVREELSGAELSEAEAALAAAAIYSDDEARSVRRLRSMLLKHFGVDELRVLSGDVVQEYLEMLHETGTFNASPVQVRNASGVRFTVLITINGR